MKRGFIRLKRIVEADGPLLVGVRHIVAVYRGDVYTSDPDGGGAVVETITGKFNTAMTVEQVVELVAAAEAT